MAGLPTPNLLSDSLNIIDPLEFDGDELPPTFKSSPMHVQKSQEPQNASASGIDLSLSQNTSASGLYPSQSLNSSQLESSGLLLQQINTQKEVRKNFCLRDLSSTVLTESKLMPRKMRKAFFLMMRSNAIKCRKPPW